MTVLLERWHQVIGERPVRVVDLVARLFDTGELADEHIAWLTGEGGRAILETALGYRFRSHVDRTFGAHRLRRGKRDNQDVYWYVEPDDPTG